MEYRFAYPVLSYKVLDGDSVRVCLDLGFGLMLNRIGRLYGVDAPEKDTEEGELVKLVVEKWTGLRKDNLTFWSTGKPKYSGRAIGHMYSSLEPAETLSAFLLGAGLSRRYSGAKRPDWGDVELGIIKKKCRELLRDDYLGDSSLGRPI